MLDLLAGWASIFPKVSFKPLIQKELQIMNCFLYVPNEN